MKVKVKIENEPNLTKRSNGDSGYDLHSAIDTELQPNERMLIPTGVYMYIPINYEAQVRPRSGLALKHGITVLNTPGTIDSNYIGEIGVILYNTSTNVFKIKKGDRIAQIVFQKVCFNNKEQDIEYIDELPVTDRKDKGFGSSGI